MSSIIDSTERESFDGSIHDHVTRVLLGLYPLAWARRFNILGGGRWNMDYHVSIASNCPKPLLHIGQYSNPCAMVKHCRQVAAYKAKFSNRDACWIGLRSVWSYMSTLSCRFNICPSGETLAAESQPSAGLQRRDTSATLPRGTSI